MAGSVKDQSDKMAALFGGKTSKPDDAKATEGKSAKVRMSVYLEPDVAEGLERLYHTRRLAGERVSRSELIEGILRQAIRDQNA